MLMGQNLKSGDYAVGESNLKVYRKKGGSKQRGGSRENTGIVTNIKISNRNFDRKNPSIERLRSSSKLSMTRDERSRSNTAIVAPSGHDRTTTENKKKKLKHN